ncbi:MAG: dTMP kinase [Planctomycetaceae bacterium]|nr:dTMP kinase [Planctomycetaceae bacterium]
MRGAFIVVEGIDGSGKSTMAGHVADELRRRRREVIRTREPGGTPISEQIRALLLDAKNSAMVPFAELFLFMASRAQLVDEVIRPSLAKGVDVVCDRYYYSTAAYQGAAGKVGIDTVMNVAEKIARFQKPDVVILLDLNPELARSRDGIRNDRVENKGVEYQKKVRAGFLKLARRDRKRVKIIDASRPPEQVFADVMKAVDRAV